MLVSIIDTGIDYTHPVFRFSNGSTRILGLWDQTVESEQVPEQFPYGTLYTSDDLNQALMTENPLDIVPSRDEEGHGPLWPGLSPEAKDRENDFIGAAPEASIIAVKLKPAKNYLRDY